MGACEMSSLVWPLRACHVTLLARPTPGLKAKPQGPRPTQAHPRWWLGRFPPTHAPTRAPYPIALAREVWWGLGWGIG
ncbi:hypothetical protein Hanom_Chr01g00030611 [Helianthus anomalus]